MENVYLVVGLGNPGRNYSGTRHNIGFMLADQLAEEWGGQWAHEKKFDSCLARLERSGHPVILCKPQTFMNASGEAVGELSRYFRLLPAQVLVVVDDADLPMGQLRMRPGGSSGGHHGLESIEAQLGTLEYPRLRLGIGRKEVDGRRITNYVLGQFSKDERETVKKVLQRAARQVECWLAAGITEAMNRFNGTVEVPSNQ